MRTPVSFEFYPPKTDEQRTQLDRTAQKLKAYAPDYVSCTFGAGGVAHPKTASGMNASLTEAQSYSADHCANQARDFSGSAGPDRKGSGR